MGILQESADEWLGYGDYKNIDSKTINNLINERNDARNKKNFEQADNIRIKLQNMGIEIEDTKNGTKWRSI